MNHRGINGQEALARLLAGNEVYCAGELALCPTKKEIQAQRDGQNPLAALVACSDSRVPPNLVFGCSLGELFVVRTAGNVLSDFGLGSIEYAVKGLHVPLVMVLGHTHCGAIASALREEETAGALGRLLAEIRLSVEKARAEATDPEQIAALAEDYNIRRGVEILRADPILREAPDTLIVGAKCDLYTGRVSLLSE